MIEFKNTILKNSVVIIFIFYSLLMFGIFYFSKHIQNANFIDLYILGHDSSRYIEGANKLLNFELPSNKGTSYLGYILFLSLFQYFELNLSYVVLSQFILTILSALCIYRITKELSSNIGGIFSMCLYLFYIPLQIKNFYILTETLFICSIIFITYFIFYIKKKYLIIIFILTIFITTIRPHGILIIPCLFFSLLCWSYTFNKQKIFYLLIIGIILALYPFINLLNFYLENEKIVYKIANYGIIYGYDNENNYLNFKLFNENKNNLLSLITFLIENINNFVISFFKKIYFFLTRIRPYYSEIHNLYIILFNLILYPLAIWGFIKKKMSTNFMNSYILISIVSAGLTFADWDGRYVLYIFPILIIFSGVGFSKIIKLIYN